MKHLGGGLALRVFAPVGKTLCLFKLNVDFLQAVKVTKQAIISPTTELVRGMGLFPA